MDNPRIIHAPINIGRRYGITSPITQYDYGYLLLPEGVELPTIYEIDFSNDEKHGTSFTVYGNSEGAEVPEVLIRTGKDVYAFYYFVGEGFGKTEFTWRIPNHCRPSRDGETPTPSQQSSIDQLIVRSNEAVETAEQSASEADQSARESAESARASANSAVQASLSESNAERAKGNAQASAESASASATASAQSASEAETARQATTSLVAEAQGYANASEQSATASANSAEQAESAKGVAQSYAQDAQTSATYASLSESTASTKASEASGYASTASQKATEASQSASQALGYKNDAESAKTASQTAQGLAESARDSAISAKNDAEQAKADAESARDEAQSIVDGISGALDDKADVITDTASGSIASFADGADGLPLKSLVVDINPVQDLHGQDSPYPAGGGKNKLGLTAGTFSNNGVTAVVDADGIVTVNGTATANAFVRLFRGTLPFTENMVLSGCPSGGSLNTYALRLLSNNGNYSDTGAGATVPSTVFSGSVDIEIRVPSGYTCTNVVFKPMLCLATATDPLVFAPYSNICPISGWAQATVNHSDADMTNPTTLTINLGQTVYGGTLNVLTGELTVYPYYASYNGETLTGEWISDRDKYVSGTTPTIGAQVVNIGAQGVTVQLEPHEVESLYGVNNLWADSGDCTAEYRADTKLYIAKKIAEAISALS